MPELERHRFERELSEPISHYTDAVSVGPLLYISGMLPLDVDGQLVGGDDPEAQADQVLSNISVVLSHLGGSFADVVKVTVFVTDMDDRVAINQARRRHFGDARPASSLVQVAALAHPGARVEIECVANITSRGQST